MSSPGDWLPCPALPCPALPSLPCPALPCPALPCTGDCRTAGVNHTHCSRPDFIKEVQQYSSTALSELPATHITSLLLPRSLANLQPPASTHRPNFCKNHRQAWWGGRGGGVEGLTSSGMVYLLQQFARMFSPLHFTLTIVL